MDFRTLSQPRVLQLGKLVHFLVSITVCEWILNYILVLHISNTYKHVDAYCLDFRQPRQPRVLQWLGKNSLLPSFNNCLWVLWVNFDLYICFIYSKKSYKHVDAYCLDLRQTSQPRVQQGLGIIVYVLGINS